MNNSIELSQRKSLKIVTAAVAVAVVIAVIICCHLPVFASNSLYANLISSEPNV